MFLYMKISFIPGLCSMPDCLYSLSQGDTCSRKSALVKAFAQITGQPLLVVSMHDAFEASEIIGEVEQHNEFFLLNLNTTHQKGF